MRKEKILCWTDILILIILSKSDEISMSVNEIGKKFTIFSKDSGIDDIASATLNKALVKFLDSDFAVRELSVPSKKGGRPKFEYLITKKGKKALEESKKKGETIFNHIG